MSQGKQSLPFASTSRAHTHTHDERTHFVGLVSEGPKLPASVMRGPLTAPRLVARGAHDMARSLSSVVVTLQRGRHRGRQGVEEDTQWRRRRKTRRSASKKVLPSVSLALSFSFFPAPSLAMSHRYLFRRLPGLSTFFLSSLLSLPLVHLAMYD